MTDDPLADVFPGTEDAEKPEWIYWGPPDHPATPRKLVPPRPKEPR